MKKKYIPSFIIITRFSFASVLLLFPLMTMAIVNMDGLHFSKTKETFKTDLDLSISGSSGNSERSKAAINAQFSWQYEKSIHLAILGYQRGESNNVRSVNKTFSHYRYIYQLNKIMDLELFAQLEKNEFTRLSYRGLLGSGLRFSVGESEHHHAFLGVGAFYSKEKVEFISGLTDHGEKEFGRANLYFLSKYKLKPTINFSNAIYYQPRLNQVSDYRALLRTKLDFKINKNLSFRLSLDIEHDSEPSQSIKSTDTSYMSGLKFNF